MLAIYNKSIENSTIEHKPHVKKHQASIGGGIESQTFQVGLKNEQYL